MLKEDSRLPQEVVYSGKINRGRFKDIKYNFCIKYQEVTRINLSISILFDHLSPPSVETSDIDIT